MQNILEQDYKALHAAALTISTHMLAALPQAMQDELERGTRQGGLLLLQLGPLPDCQRVELVLREREGATHVIASIGVEALQ
jgi:hypothetical protein